MTQHRVFALVVVGALLFAESSLRPSSDQAGGISQTDAIAEAGAAQSALMRWWPIRSGLQASHRESSARSIASRKLPAVYRHRTARTICERISGQAAST